MKNESCSWHFSGWPHGGPVGSNMLGGGGGCKGNFLFWYFSSKEMIRFHPNLVGIILRGKRSKVAKMVHVVPREWARGRAPKGKNYVNFKHLLLQIGK